MEENVITCKTNTSLSSDKEGRRLFERLFGGSLLRSDGNKDENSQCFNTLDMKLTWALQV